MLPVCCYKSSFDSCLPFSAAGMLCLPCGTAHTQAIVLRDSVCGLADVDKSSLNDRDRQVSTFFILAAIVGAVILLTVLGLAQVRGGHAFLAAFAAAFCCCGCRASLVIEDPVFPP